MFRTLQTGIPNALLRISVSGRIASRAGPPPVSVILLKSVPVSPMTLFGVAKLNFVEEVEYLPSELHRDALGDLGILCKAKIKALLVRTTQDVPTEVSEAAVLRFTVQTGLSGEQR